MFVQIPDIYIMSTDVGPQQKICEGDLFDYCLVSKINSVNHR